MEGSFDTLTTELLDEVVLLVTLNRPAVANALDTRMGEELGGLWRALYVDGAAVRCVVVTGAGERAFCAGGDLKERDAMSDAALQRQHAIFEQMMRARVACPVPGVAAGHGAAYGGGGGVAMSALTRVSAVGGQFRRGAELERDRGGVHPLLEGGATWAEG